MHMCSQSEATKEACVASVQAEIRKNDGNAAVRKKQWKQAIACYSEAIYLDDGGKDSHLYYSNRSMCYERLKDWANSEAGARRFPYRRISWGRGRAQAKNWT